MQATTTCRPPACIYPKPSAPLAITQLTRGDVPTELGVRGPDTVDVHHRINRLTTSVAGCALASSHNSQLHTKPVDNIVIAGCVCVSRRVCVTQCVVCLCIAQAACNACTFLVPSGSPSARANTGVPPATSPAWARPLPGPTCLSRPSISGAVKHSTASKMSRNSART
jgi:hypothetical protein